MKKSNLFPNYRKWRALMKAKKAAIDARLASKYVQTMNKHSNSLGYIDWLSKKAAEGGMKALELLGEPISIATIEANPVLTPLVNILPEKLKKTVKDFLHKALNKAFSYLSPVNHIAAWTLGTIDPEVGAEAVSKLDPRLLFPLRIGEMYALGKVSKGIGKVKENTTVSGSISPEGNLQIIIPTTKYKAPLTKKISISSKNPLMESPTLSEGMKKAGWTLKEDGTYIHPDGKTEYVRYKGQIKRKDQINSIIKGEKRAAAIKMTPARLVLKIRNKYISAIEDNARTTGINWSDQNSVMAPMPDELKLSPVGFDTKTPFLTRYYNNVMKVIGKGGIQEELLKNGDLRKNSSGQWEGIVNGRYQRVEPTEYIKMRIANRKGESYGLKVSLAPISPGVTRYPMHGTKTKNWGYLTKSSSSPGKNGYFTGVLGTKGSNLLIDHYKGRGISVPFFRMPLFETNILPRNLLGIDSNTLMPNIEANPGKIQIATDVIDSEVGFGKANEYNFGPNVPNPKSMWNTLDFQEGAGPLAYNYQESESNIT